MRTHIPCGTVLPVNTTVLPAKAMAAATQTANRPGTAVRHLQVAAHGLMLTFVQRRAMPAGGRPVGDGRDLILVALAAAQHAGGFMWFPAGQPAALPPRAPSGDYCAITLPTGLLGTRAPAARTLHRDPFLFHTVARIGTCAGRTGNAVRLFCESALEMLLLHLKDQYGDPPRIQSTGALEAITAARVREVIEADLAAETNLAALARFAGLSVRDFGFAFKATFGSSPHQYILDRRIARAKALLSGSAAAITDVSAATGFATPSHFATTFKKRVGMTPTEYRGGR